MQQALAVYQAEYRKDNGKERPEIELCEEQRRVLLEEKDMFEEVNQLLHSVFILPCNRQ